LSLFISLFIICIFKYKKKDALKSMSAYYVKKTLCCVLCPSHIHAHVIMVRLLFAMRRRRIGSISLAYFTLHFILTRQISLTYLFTSHWRGWGDSNRCSECLQQCLASRSFHQLHTCAHANSHVCQILHLSDLHTHTHTHTRRVCRVGVWLIHCTICLLLTCWPFWKVSSTATFPT
jgi:hypothetical protein